MPFKFFMQLRPTRSPRAMNLRLLLQMLYILNLLFLLDNLMALVKEKNIVLQIIKDPQLMNELFGKLNWQNFTKPLDILQTEVWFGC